VRFGRDTRWGAAAIGLAVAAGAVAGLGELATPHLIGPGAPVAQAALPGAGDPGAPVARGPLRVVVVDGLSRADSDRLPALVALCAAGADLVVDVGFPTRSLLIQEALWTGLTAQQLGSPYTNQPRPPHPGALPARVDSIAVVESYRAIASSVGFARIAPADPAADWADPRATPAAVAAWRRTGFDAAAVRAVASPAALVMVHAVGLDQAAHHHGRRGDAYAAALSSADRTLAAVVAATPPDAMIVALADHGHLAGGGHGDAEDEVRRVRACVRGAGIGAPPGAAVHLIDRARLVRARLGVAPLPEARGRPLAIAVARPAPDATLPRPPTWRWLLAMLVIAAGGAAALVAAGPGALWPLASLGLWILVRGAAPSLSCQPELDRVLAIALVPAALALAIAGTPRRLAIVAAAALVPAVGAAIACDWLGHLAGGPPARVPGWTGQLAAWAALAVAGLGLGAAIAALRWLSGGRTVPGARPARHRAGLDGASRTTAVRVTDGAAGAGSGARTADVRSADGTGGIGAPGPVRPVRRADTRPPPDA
jgi:hypothetical protein